MAPSKQITKKISARAVYSRNALKGDKSKGRGRPRKYPTKDLKKAKSLVKKASTPSRKQSHKVRVRRMYISPGDSSDDENIVDAIVVNGRDYKRDIKKDEESSDGEFGDKQFADDEEEIDDGEASEEIQEEESSDIEDSDENVLYSFAEKIPVTETSSKMKLNQLENIEHMSSIVNSSKQKNEIMSVETTSFREISSIRKFSQNETTEHMSPVVNSAAVEEFKNEIFSKRKLSQQNIEHISPVVHSAKRKKIKIGNDKLSSPHDSNNISTEPQRLIVEFDPANQMNPVDLPNSSASLIAMNKASSCGNVSADNIFLWLISPLSVDNFFKDIYEHHPFHLNRKMPNYYADVFSSNDIHTMLKENNLLYNEHIDVVKYVNGERIDQPSLGRAFANNVWNDYEVGYSVRIRAPQSYNKKIWTICSLLQEYFSSTAGCNAYLTPAGAQGFAPHYDDIDGFIAQVEGSKYWKIYRPRNDAENLARYSSGDFAQSEIGEPLIEVLLEPGDLLYIPRGFIHQASTNDTQHSLHLTFSVNQLNTWGDLLLSAATKALERAISDDIEFRTAVPRDFTICAGASNCKSSTANQRIVYKNKLKYLFSKISNYLDVDEAADCHAEHFIKSCLPSAFNAVEKQRSIIGNGSYLRNGRTVSRADLTLDTEIQFIRKQVVRLIVEESGPKLYHNLDNTKHRLDPDEVTANYYAIEEYQIPAYNYLIQHHPEFVEVRNLPLEHDDAKLEFASLLYESALVMTKEPLPMQTNYVSD